MDKYKYASIAPIVDGIGLVLTELGQMESKAFLLAQFSRDDTFAGLAKNLCEWRNKFIINSILNSNLENLLNALEEYFEERKVLQLYLGKTMENESSTFSISDFLTALTWDYPGF